MKSSRSIRGIALAGIIFSILTLSGCSHLIIRPDDSGGEVTAKIAARIPLGLITLGLSEANISKLKRSAPVTDGFHQSLPESNATIVVLGDNSIAASAAVTWLQKRGLKIVERTGLQKVFNEQAIRLTHTPDDEAIFLKVGHLLGASTIVLIDTLTSSGQVSQSSMYFGKYGGYGGSYSTTVSSSGVSVRAVDVENGSLVWTGRANYRVQSAGAPEDAITKLTCQALATAWGFRPAGDDFIPSQEMCELKELRPSPR